MSWLIKHNKTLKNGRSKLRPLAERYRPKPEKWGFPVSEQEISPLGQDMAHYYRCQQRFKSEGIESKI